MKFYHVEIGVEEVYFTDKSVAVKLGTMTHRKYVEVDVELKNTYDYGSW